MITIGTYVAIVMLIVLSVTSLAFASLVTIYIKRWDRTKKYHEDTVMALSFFGAGLVISLIFLAGIAWGLYPFEWQYHRYTKVEGVVTSVDARMLDQTQNYVVGVNGQQYRCDDTRCAALHPGTRVTMHCLRVWQYASEDGWVCNYG